MLELMALHDNSGPYDSAVNSNNWFGGRFTAPVGIYDYGSLNNYYSPDLESCGTAGIQFAGQGSSVYSPYEEANGPDNFTPGADGSAVYGAPVGYSPIGNSTGNNVWFAWHGSS